MKQTITFLITSFLLIQAAIPAGAFGLPFAIPTPIETHIIALETPLNKIPTLQPEKPVQEALKPIDPKVTKCKDGNILIIGDKWIKYDADNRPVKIITADGTVTDFVYDYEGNRVKKIVDGIETLYIGDLYEITPSETIKHIYAGSDRIASIGSVSGTKYIHIDHLGSTSIITDEAGNVVQETKYTPFGTVWETSADLTDRTYTGQRKDDSTGLMYYGARYYDPSFGRFISCDSIVQAPYDPQSLNRYTYVRNNPINLVDPSGHSWLSKSLKGTERYLKRSWNYNRDSIVNAGTAFVLSGFNPVAAAAAFGGTQFVQSHGGQKLVGNTAMILYKNNLMGAREAQIFSEIFWLTASSMAIEKGLSSFNGGLQARDPGVTDPSLLNEQSPRMGRSTKQLVADGGYVETLTANNGNKAVVAYDDAFKVKTLGKIGVKHASASSSLLTSQTAIGQALNPFSYAFRGTCHQYANTNLLTWGFGAATTRGFGHFTSAIYGYYGGQMWSKISYSAWQSEKRW